MGRGNEHRQRQFGAQPADPWGHYDPPPLPPSYERTPRSQPSRASAGRETGARVKWFNPDKGFGFVELTDGSGEAFLHIRQVEAAGHSSLPSGTTLVVQVGPGQRGPQITEILHVDTSTAEPEPARSPRPSSRPGASRQGASPVASPDRVGTVKWYDEVKGFGFIAVEGEGKDLFVHVSVLQRAGLNRLDQGQTVRVAIVEGRKGPEVGAVELA